MRPNASQPVFLTRQCPYHAITGGTVASNLQDALKVAGLFPDYSAWDFRPTGATYQVKEGFDPDIVMKIGRWKTRSVFFLALCSLKNAGGLHRPFTALTFHSVEYSQTLSPLCAKLIELYRLACLTAYTTFCSIRLVIVLCAVYILTT